MRLLSTLCALITLSLIFPVWVHADGLSLSPAFVELTISQASPSAQARLQITNTSPTTETLSLAVVDISQVDSEGRVELRTKPEEGNALSFASYLKLEQDTITVASQATVAVNLTLRDDADLSPGGHYAAVLLRGQRSETQTGQHVIPALTAFVLVHKQGGERYHLSLQPIETLRGAVQFRFPRELALRFRNDGNTHLAPYGQVEVRDRFGRLVYEGTINVGSRLVLPGSERTIPVQLEPRRFPFPLMLYTLKVSGTTRPGAVTYAQEQVWLHVSPIALLWLFGIIVGIVGVRSYRRRANL